MLFTTEYANTIIWTYQFLGIHAREWISPATATYILQELIDQSHEIDSLLTLYDVFILPVANPDG